jgi:hypothetical protein
VNLQVVSRVKRNLAARQRMAWAIKGWHTRRTSCYGAPVINSLWARPRLSQRSICTPFSVSLAGRPRSVATNAEVTLPRYTEACAVQCRRLHREFPPWQVAPRIADTWVEEP